MAAAFIATVATCLAALPLTAGLQVGSVSVWSDADSVPMMPAQGFGRTGGNLETPISPVPPAELKEIFMRYMPSRNTVVCGCAKCGTSSMYDFIYAKEFGQAWPYKGEPYVHELTSPRWKNKFQVVLDWTRQQELMDTAFSFALIRDPKERLVSAWKSKIACGAEYHTDFQTRPWMTGELRLLAGLPGVQPCMSLEDFLSALATIHSTNKSYLLDRHFLPQNLGCFYRTNPANWSKVVNIEEQDSLRALGEHLDSNDTQAPSEHSSTSKILISPLAEELLNNVTKNEYELLGPYLNRPSRVFSGIWALRGLSPEK